MSALVAALLLLAVAAPAASAVEQPDAALLLDLDLLRERDPRLQHDESMARNVGLLELLERLERPAAARRGAQPQRAPKEDC